jgi:hypothetical protein
MGKKLSKNFKRKKIPDLLVLAEGVLERSKTHPALQGARPEFLPIDTLPAAIVSLRTSYSGALGGSFDMKKQRDRDLDALSAQLTTLATYYETAGVHNPDYLLNTGFEEAAVQKKGIVRPLEAVSSLDLWHGSHPGLVYAKVPQVPQAKGYEIYFTDSDPTVEQNWKFQGTHFTCSKMEVGGLDGGKVYSFKIRAANKNDKGPFSPVGTIRAL